MLANLVVFYIPGCIPPQAENTNNSIVQLAVFKVQMHFIFCSGLVF